MAQELYTLGKKKNTGEYHLFRSYKNAEGTCMVYTPSICKEKEHSDTSSYSFTCEDENVARKKCAEIGRLVCGTCVSDLYKTK